MDRLELLHNSTDSNLDSSTCQKCSEHCEPLPPPAVEVFSTGARRSSRAGRGRFDLLPPAALAELAKHLENGAKYYGDRNWQRGMPVSRFLDSALRHLFQYLDGQTDEPHLAAAAFNVLAAMEMEQQVKAGRLPQHLIDLGPHCRVDE